MLRGLLPPSHGLTGTYQADLALALARDGRHAEAQRVIADVLPQGRRPHDLSATWPSYVLGVTKRLAGDPGGALRVQQQLLASMRDGQASELDRMRTLMEIGVNLQALAKPDQAVPYLEEALTLSLRGQTRMNPDRAEILVTLGRAKMATGRPADALPHLEEAAHYWRAFAPTHPAAAEAARWLRRCRASTRLPTNIFLT